MVKGNKITKFNSHVYFIEDNYFCLNRPIIKYRTRNMDQDKMNKILWYEEYHSEDLDDFYIPHIIKADYYKKRS